MSSIGAVLSLLAALTSLGCMLLLFRAYAANGLRLLLWSALCFVCLTANNTLLFFDLAVFPDVDLRAVPAGRCPRRGPLPALRVHLGD